MLLQYLEIYILLAGDSNCLEVQTSMNLYHEHYCSLIFGKQANPGPTKHT